MSDCLAMRGCAEMLAELRSENIISGLTKIETGLRVTRNKAFSHQFPKHSYC